MGLIGFLPTKGIAFIYVYWGSERCDRRCRFHAWGEEKYRHCVHLTVGNPDSRSRDYVCPVCKVKNIELLPDAEPGSTNDKPKENTVVLSFGYQKDQNDSTPQNTTATSAQPPCHTLISDTPRPASPSVETPTVPERSVRPTLVQAVAQPDPPSPWIDRALVVCLALLVALLVRKFTWV